MFEIEADNEIYSDFYEMLSNHEGFKVLLQWSRPHWVNRSLTLFTGHVVVYVQCSIGFTPTAFNLICFKKSLHCLAMVKTPLITLLIKLAHYKVTKY